MTDGISPPRLPLALGIVAWCAIILASIVFAVGPIALPAVGLSISGVSRLLWLIAASVVIAIARRRPRLLLHDLGASSSLHRTTVALTIALTAVLLVARGSTSVGGADSAGYLAQAARWHAHTLRTPLPLTLPPEVPDRAWLQSPLGFRPDPTNTATVPSYPPGLPWLQALALSVGGEPAAVRGLPLAAALLALLATYLLARRHATPASAALAVTLLACTPAFLFQALQPMSDVPALAAWLLALVLASRRAPLATASSALLVAVAIAIRPNLAPLALAVCWQAAATGAVATRPARTAAIATMMVGAVVGVAALQAVLYGSPFLSGYGRASDLFSTSFVWPNMGRYAAWLVESVSPVGRAWLVAGTAYATWRATVDRTLRPLVSMGAMTVVLYLVYVPFDSWTYLRFVLIALAVACVGAAVLCDRLLRRVALPWRVPVSCALTLLVAIPNLQRAQALGVFDVRAREYRYQAAGAFIRHHLPSSVILVAAQHSTSAAYYSGRPVLRLDLIDPTSIPVIATWATRERRPLAFVLDSAEVEQVRKRLSGVDLAALDWPPRAEIGRPVMTRVWLVDDRDAYRAGASIRTIRLAGAPD